MTTETALLNGTVGLGVNTTAYVSMSGSTTQKSQDEDPYNAELMADRIAFGVFTFIYIAFHLGFIFRIICTVNEFFS